MHRRLRDLTSRCRERERGSQAPAPCLPCQQQDGVRQFSLTAPAGPSVTDDFVPTLNPDVAWATIDGHLVLHDPWREHLHVLNSTAAFIWACVDDVSTTAELIDQVLIETEGPPETVAADVRAGARAVLAPRTSCWRNRRRNLGSKVARPSPNGTRGNVRVKHGNSCPRSAPRGCWNTGTGFPASDPGRLSAVPVLVRTNVATVGAYLDVVLAALPAADALPSTSSGDVRTISCSSTVDTTGHTGIGCTGTTTSSCEPPGLPMPSIVRSPR